ncbi:putative RNA-binding protein ARP1 [Bienertia sinuspersici]
MTMSDTNNNGQFGDTTLTKVFVGGLAWETPKEAMYEHFEKYGHILEAVIISDKITGRSKGYGFVTFKEAEAAKKACEDATPMINGRGQTATWQRWVLDARHAHHQHHTINALHPTAATAVVVVMPQ